MARNSTKKTTTRARKTTAQRPHWSTALDAIRACPEACAWAATQPSFTTAWQTCERGNWMLWLVGTVMGGAPESAERKRVVAAASACARLVLPIYEKHHPNDPRVRNCLDVAQRWVDGTATLTELREARADAYAAAAADAAAYAAAAAAYAAAAAAAAAADAAAADAAAAAAAAAAAYAAADAARHAVQRQCADIARQHFTAAEVAKALTARAK